jgi:acyl dehydratase
MREEIPRTDQLQPLSEVQIRQVREFVDEQQRQRVSRWDLPEEDERSWELHVTPELAILYADGVEDFNPWYEDWLFGKGTSPFGPAIAPPLLLSHWVLGLFWAGEKGMRSVGAMHVYHDTQILAPCPLGTRVRYRGKIVKKYIKRGRQYIRTEVLVEDADTGKLLLREIRESMAQYGKVSE